MKKKKIETSKVLFSLNKNIAPYTPIDPKDPALYKMEGLILNVGNDTDLFLVAPHSIIQKNRKGNFIKGAVEGKPVKARIIKIIEVYYKLDELVEFAKVLEIDIDSPRIKCLFTLGTEKEKEEFIKFLNKLNPFSKEFLIQPNSPNQQTFENDTPFIAQILSASLYSVLEATIRVRTLKEKKKNELRQNFPNQDIINQIDSEIDYIIYQDSLNRANEENALKLYRKENNEFVKVSLYSQLQKQGRNRTQQNDLFSMIENESDPNNKQKLLDKQVEYGIEVVGLDLSISQERALFTIQTMLNKTNYKGNAGGEKIQSSTMKFDGIVPSIRFTPAEYLATYGVTKYQTGRGKMEYSSSGRDEALKALRDLSINRYLIIYERKYFNEKHKDRRSDIIRTISPLIVITEGFEDLSEKESENLKNYPINTEPNEKLKVIAVQPNPVLIQDIDNYFVLKPANCYQEIKLLVGHASVFVYRFVDYLITTVTQGVKDWKIKISYEVLGTILRMDSYTKTRNWKKMRLTINKCYEIAKKLGYLTDYQIDQKGVTKNVDILILNPEKFYKTEEIKKRRQEIEEAQKAKSLPNGVAKST